MARGLKYNSLYSRIRRKRFLRICLIFPSDSTSISDNIWRFLAAGLFASANVLRYGGDPLRFSLIVSFNSLFPLVTESVKSLIASTELAATCCPPLIVDLAVLSPQPPTVLLIESNLDVNWLSFNSK